MISIDNDLTYLKNNIKFITLYLTLLLLAGTIEYSFSGKVILNSSDPHTSIHNSAPYNVSGSDTITIVAVGDLMCHSPQYQSAKTSAGYDFSEVFSAVKPYLSSADLCFGNLETVTAGPDENYSGYPQFNTPAAYLQGMKDAGFDVATNVNNHSLDRRFKGIERTIDSLDKVGLLHTGTYKNAEDTSQTLVVEAKGIKIAVLGYTFSTNGIPLPVGKEFCVNMIDSGRMKRDVERAQKTGADKIAVFIHWGNEYERYPNNYQKKYANYLSELGVDLIFGSHPHVLQPTEIISKNNKPTFVIYSMGNFVSGQRKPFTDYGVIIRMQLIKDRSTGITKTGKIDFIPTYVSTQKGGFKILPVADAINAYDKNLTDHLSYSPGDISRLKAIWKEATDHLTNKETNIFPHTQQ
ncbi:MAG: CapA family protein [Ferruginibacter sp.]|nr:CapA family protein [Ferruginibacter sp.]